jgi:hypothetical protein
LDEKCLYEDSNTPHRQHELTCAQNLRPPRRRSSTPLHTIYSRTTRKASEGPDLCV